MTSDWGLKANGDCNSAISELTVLQGRSLGCARDDDGAKRYQNSAALHYYLRRTTIPHFSFRIQAEPKDGTSSGLTL